MSSTIDGDVLVKALVLAGTGLLFLAAAVVVKGIDLGELVTTPDQ